MDDEGIHETIKRLVAEEHSIWSTPTASTADHERLRQIGESLDQCWDLLRQREARREAGDDPNAAKSRPVDEVESYLQ
ncbi:MAG: DUF2630 family protein [Acidothermaceae bacterium]